MQQNNKCRLYGNRDKIIIYMISEYSLLAQNEYKTSRNWVRKVIHRILRKKLKFNHKSKHFGVVAIEKRAFR